ncbi:hypothetical protein [Hominenteromicrobium sp.]|uniref:hypothetical protein n=1 Tax=Hominenteromicrobium sp. TaxID=3073581 RepID=UPI003999A380
MNQKDIETLAIALPEDILKAKWCGDFDRAFHLIDLYLANEKVPAFMKTRLALEREVLKALPTGYTYSEEDALALVRRKFRISRRQSLTHCVTAAPSTGSTSTAKRRIPARSTIRFWAFTRISPRVQASRRRTKVIAWNFCAKMYAT